MKWRWPSVPLRRAILILAIVGFAVAIIVQVRSGTEVAQVRAVKPAELALSLLADETAEAPPDVALIERRPLFHASRAFYAPPPPDALPATPPIPDYRLVGTFRMPNRPAVATLAQSGSAAVLRVRAGDVMEGWTVRAVEAQRVVLQFESTEHVITSGAGAASSGLRVVVADAAPPSAASSGLRVLGAGGPASTMRVTPMTRDKPRLYRPPPSRP